MKAEKLELQSCPLNSNTFLPHVKLCRFLALLRWSTACDFVITVRLSGCLSVKAPSHASPTLFLPLQTSSTSDYFVWQMFACADHIKAQTVDTTVAGKLWLSVTIENNINSTKEGASLCKVAQIVSERASVQCFVCSGLFTRTLHHSWGLHQNKKSGMVRNHADTKETYTFTFQEACCQGWLQSWNQEPAPKTKSEVWPKNRVWLFSSLHLLLGSCCQIKERWPALGSNSWYFGPHGQGLQLKQTQSFFQLSGKFVLFWNFIEIQLHCMTRLIEMVSGAQRFDSWVVSLSQRSW